MGRKTTSSPAEARALQALRAGSMTCEEAGERWPTCGSGPFLALIRRGLVIKDGDHFYLTPAGRAACPWRNPQAAPGAQPQPQPMEVKTMSSTVPAANLMQLNDVKLSPIQAVLYEQVLDAGRNGATVAAMAKRRGKTESATYQLLLHLKNQGLVTGQGVKSRWVATMFSKMPEPANVVLPPIESGKVAGQESAPETASTAAATPKVAVATPDVATSPASTVTGNGEGLRLPEFNPAKEQVGAPVHGFIHVARDEELIRQARTIVDLRGQITELERRLAAFEAGARASTRYAIAFPADFHASIDDAVAQAIRDYESGSLKDAVVIACSPIGGIDLRPVFVPAVAA